MANIITKDDERHPTHAAYKNSHADVKATAEAEAKIRAEVEATKKPKEFEAAKEEKPAAKVPERKVEKPE